MDRLTKEYKRLVRDSWRFFYLSHRTWAKAIEDMGLSAGTYSSLEMIVQNPGVTQQDISDELSIDKSCTSRACKYLETNGFIYREKSPDCTHGFKCYPTEKAIEVCEKVIGIEKVHIHALFADIDTGELETASAMMDKLIEKLKGQQ
ncbi:MAG: MarR family transcriptional regulator [Clostridiales bacterium]|nr:MarR family transcriptional regulator [Clostridiales bacterium]